MRAVAQKFWKPIINNFNPVGPMSLEDVRKFFVDRNEDDSAQSLVEYLKINFQNNIGEPKPYKALLTGHIGSGKSSELMRLGEELAEDFLVVRFDADTSLHKETVNQFDVILGMGLALHIGAQLADLHPSNKLINDLIKSLAKFVRTYEGRKGFSLRLDQLLNKVAVMAITTGASALGVPAVASAVAGVLATSRLELKVSDSLVKTLEQPANRQEVIGALNKIIDWIQSEAGRPVLVITDGLDKIDAQRARLLFANSTLLTEPICALIYSTPVEFYHRLDAEQAVNLFNSHEMLPNPPVHRAPEKGKEWKQARDVDESSLEIMRKVVDRRLKSQNHSRDEMITQDALDWLAKMSGGIMRDIVRNFREAAVLAQLRGQMRIDETIVRSVIDRRRQESISRLKVSHRETLERVLRQGALSGGTYEDIEDELLHSSFLLSYKDNNGNSWFDAHPIILPLL